MKVDLGQTSAHKWAMKHDTTDKAKMDGDTTIKNRALYVRQDKRFMKIGTINIITGEINITAVSEYTSAGREKKSDKWKWKNKS